MLKKYYLKHKERIKRKRYLPEGVIYQRWRGIVERTEKKIKNHSSALGKGHMTKEEFFNWANNDDFKRLYNIWKENNFRRDLAPSIDRIDLSK